MTKIAYNMYSCAISGMSVEIMKMDDRDSAECQNWEKKNIMIIIEIVLNENNAKIVYSTPLLKLKREENGQDMAVAKNGGF